MATIGQMCQFMNEKGCQWWPQYVCDVELRESSGNQVVEANKDDGIVYRREDRQKYLGHYFVAENLGGPYSSIVLMPLNNGYYLKAVVL